MRAITLRAALAEYRPSLPIRMRFAGKVRFDLTVAEMLSNLCSVPEDEHVTFFGATDFIIKERNADFGSGRAVAEPELPFAPDAPLRDYLEIDARL